MSTPKRIPISNKSLNKLIKIYSNSDELYYFIIIRKN